MSYLSKNHDPNKNEILLSRWLPSNRTLADLAKETDAILHRKLHMLPPLPEYKLKPEKNLKYAFPRFLLTTKRQPELQNPAGCTIMDGQPYPDWKKKLDKEYQHLNDSIEEQVNVTDYGAVGDGITDNTQAFKTALGKGKRMVYIPEGVFIVKGLKLPSYTCLVGEGKDKTILKLANESPKKAILITNANPIRGNHHILVQGMTLDWNVERLTSNEQTSSGNNQSSCLTYAHVTYGWVKDVGARNAGLHCFDVSAAFYTYFGDGTRSRWPSQYIWLNHLNGEGFGDDGVTTHHSSHILITNSHMCDPSGRAHEKGFSNSNGFEVDDGSDDVWLINNSSTRCFGGVEIKAHDTASAASNVHIIGHLSIHDNRSYNFRHIGHHLESEPQSKSAFNITATNIVAISPIFTDLYKGSTPRCLVVSAYQNVVINHFTLLGDPNYDYQKNPMISIQYKSRHITLQNITIENFQTAGTDIKVVGGSQHTDDIRLSNISIKNSAPTAIEIGKGVVKANISNVQAESKIGDIAIKTANQGAKLNDIQTVGYKTPILVTNNKLIKT